MTGMRIYLSVLFIFQNWCRNAEISSKFNNNDTTSELLCSKRDNEGIVRTNCLLSTENMLKIRNKFSNKSGFTISHDGRLICRK